MTPPLAAEATARIAAGLAVSVLGISWKDVPLRYFRTNSHILLVLFLLTIPAAARSEGSGSVAILAAIGAAASFFAGPAWGIGLPLPATALGAIASLAGLAMIVPPFRDAGAAAWGLEAGAALDSALVVGCTLSAMLLGHHYLTAPAMSLRPLRILTAGSLAALFIRALIAGWGAWAWANGRASGSGAYAGWFAGMLAARWVVGIVSAGVAAILAWRTVRIRSTQSATGILYIQTILTLFGEILALALSRIAQVVL